MKLFDSSTTGGGKDNPCELVSAYLLHERDGGDFRGFIRRYDWNSRDELERGIRHLLRSVVLDPYMRRKHLADDNPAAALVYSRFNKIMTNASSLDKYPSVTAAEIWHGGYSRERLEERTAAMFSKQPNAATFASACERLKRIYNLTDDDVNKLHFFVEQVKAADKFPNSLRRMLYIYGTAKMTGKTTTGKILTCLLNGDNTADNIAAYSSTLKYEMQIQSFAVPKISECNAVLMDECFYSDMGKTYADFKRFLTSANGRARVPFGQEFEWIGQPNYIATSNEPLIKFIKDWNDRRFLSVEFRGAPTERLKMSDILLLWRDFVTNSTRTKDFETWAAELAPVAEESGERQQIADELEVDIRRSEFLTRIMNLSNGGGVGANIANANNRIALKTFVGWFSENMGAFEAHKRRGEIETAITKVFGPKYGGSCYWLIDKMQDVARQLLAVNANSGTDTQQEAETTQLPF